MAGLLARLFGRKTDETANGRDFFLSPDEAKTMGDIDYMRTPKKIHHTFHTVGEEGLETIDFYDEVSSMGHIHSDSQH